MLTSLGGGEQSYSVTAANARRIIPPHTHDCASWVANEIERAQIREYTAAVQKRRGAPVADAPAALMAQILMQIDLVSR